MSRLPQLERDLVQAAGRRLLAAWGPRLLRPVLALAVLVGVVVVVGITTGAGDPEREVVIRGPDPASLYGDAPPEGGSRYTVKPRTLARYQDLYAIVGYELKVGDDDTTVCLDVRFLRERSGSGCHSGTERAQGTSGAMSAAYAVGATSEEVDEIRVRYRDHQREGTSPATLLHAEHRDALAPLGLEPFTFYLAELPRGAKPLQATAKRDGAVVWEAAFP